MSCLFRKRILSIATALASLGWVVLPCAAQGTRLGDWSGQVELSYERDRQDTTSPGSEPRSFDTDRFRERVDIRNDGAYIVDPRLFNLTFGFSAGFFQEDNNFEERSGTQDGNLIGYSLEALFLGEKPLSLLFLANQDEDVVNRDFGARTDVSSTNYVARFNLRENSILRDWGIPYFTSTLSLEKHETVEDTTGVNQLFRRNEDRQVVDYGAHKGYETADLDFRMKFEDIVDSVRSAASFRTFSTSLDYSLDFGSNLNRRWDSRISWFDRSGAAENTSLLVHQLLRIDHSRSLTTNYRYFLDRFETSAGLNTTHTLAAGLRHRLYRNLVTTVNVLGRHGDIPSGTRDLYSGGIDMNYQHRAPWSGRLSMNAAFTAQLNDNDLTSSVVDIVDEPHQAPPVLGAGRGFTLANPFVIAGSIEVVNVRGGSRIPTEAGIDYEILEEGGRTRIIPLVTSVVIQPGDPLVVSYSFEVSPSIRFSTLFWSFGGRLDYGWLAFFGNHEQSNENLLAGRDNGFLEDREFDNVGIELNGNWWRFGARASAGYEREDSTRLKFGRWRFGQYLSINDVFGFNLGLSGDQAFTDFDLPVNRRREDYAGRADVDAFLFSGWNLRGFAGIRILQDTQVPNEEIREAGLSVQRRLGLLTVRGSVNWNRFERGEVLTRDLFIELRAQRRF